MPRSEALKKSQQKYYTNSYVRLYLSSKANARKHGIPHSLSMADIKAIMPAICPVFGVPFTNVTGEGRGGRQPFNPSIDRLDPAKGYTTDNIQIISYLANRMKQDATKEQLIAFAEGVLKLYKK